MLANTLVINMSCIFIMGSYAESLVNFRGQLLCEMVARGHQVHACAPVASNEIMERLSAFGVKYHFVPLDRTGMNPLHDVEFIIKLVFILKSIKPDIYLGYTIKSVIYGSIAARLAGVPAIFSMITGLGFSFSGDTFKSRVVGRVSGLLYRLALRFNRNIIFQNPDDLELFKKRGFVRKEKQLVLVNGSGVDIDEFAPVAYPSTLSFLLIARLIRDKGIYEYISAAIRVREMYPGVNFRLAGWIDKNPNSIDESDLKSWQESGDIEFIGRLDDVRPSIANSSVYVLPSYREGTPRTVLEAMAMGRPIITTDVPGCRETVINGVNGYLVHDHDVDGLVDVDEEDEVGLEVVDGLVEVVDGLEAER